VSWLLRLIGLWGVVDSVWLAVDRASWSRFWGGVIGRVGSGDARLAWALAATELVVSLGLVWGKGSKR